MRLGALGRLLSVKGLAVLLLPALLVGCASSTDDSLHCGTVSDYLLPDRAENYYRVVVTHFNGQPVISRPNYQLAPGEYTFNVVELIDAPSLRVALAARTSKPIVITVEVGQRYHLAAKFNTDKGYFGTDTGYWQPEVWRQEAHECQFSTSSL